MKIKKWQKILSDVSGVPPEDIYWVYKYAWCGVILFYDKETRIKYETPPVDCEVMAERLRDCPEDIWRWAQEYHQYTKEIEEEKRQEEWKDYFLALPV